MAKGTVPRIQFDSNLMSYSSWKFPSSRRAREGRERHRQWVLLLRSPRGLRRYCDDIMMSNWNGTIIGPGHDTIVYSVALFGLSQCLLQSHSRSDDNSGNWLALVGRKCRKNQKCLVSNIQVVSRFPYKALEPKHKFVLEGVLHPFC